MAAKTSTSTVQVRMDTSLKEETEQILERMGLTMTSAFTVFARAIVNYGKIPFEITDPRHGDPFWSEANQRHLRASIRELEKGRGEEHELIEA